MEIRQISAVAVEALLKTHWADYEFLKKKNHIKLGFSLIRFSSFSLFEASLSNYLQVQGNSQR